MMVEQAQNAYGLNTVNAVNLAWDQGIKNQALLQELDKLGIDAGKDQLEQIISSDQSIVLNPLFQNEIGLFDFNKFSSYISQLKSSNPNLYDQWRFQELNIISLAKQKIYFDLIEAYNWLKKQKGLLSLVLILGICNFLWGFTQVLLPPMILSFTDARGLGIVESSIGLAFLLGSIISLRLADKLQGNLKVAIYMGLLGGISLILGSLRPSIILLCIHGIINGVSGTVQYTVSSGAWLAITTEDIRGRALALRGTIAQMLRPLGVVIAGPLGDYLEFDFYPNNIELLSPFVGLGHGRGYAFLFFIVGILYVGIWILNFNNKNLRNLSRQVKEITNN